MRFALKYGSMPPKQRIHIINQLATMSGDKREAFFTNLEKSMSPKEKETVSRLFGPDLSRFPERDRIRIEALNKTSSVEQHVKRLAEMKSMSPQQRNEYLLQAANKLSVGVVFNYLLQRLPDRRRIERWG